MTNVLEELLDIFRKYELSTGEIVAADINRCTNWNLGDIQQILLPVNYNLNEFQTFLEKLDFENTDPWGSQAMFGTVWLTNGRWLERTDYYDGDWWQLKEYPTFPPYVIKK